MLESSLKIGKKIVDDSFKGYQKLVNGFVTAVENSSDFTRLCRVGSNALTALTPSRAGGLQLPLSRAVMVLDATQVFVDIGDLMSGKMLRGKMHEVAQRVAFFAANILTTTLWGSQLGFFALTAGAAAAMGTAASALAGVGFLIGALDAVYRLVNLDDHPHKKEAAIHASLDLIACVASVALTVIGIFGLTSNPVGIAVLALVAAGCGLCSFIYAANHRKELLANDEMGEGSFGALFSESFEKTENLEKICKLVVKPLVWIGTKASLALADDLGIFFEVHGLTSIPKRIKEWTIPNDKGEFFWQTADPLKITNKILLTILGLCTTAKFFIKYKLADLSALASATIGGLPFLSIATVTSGAALSTLGAIQNGLSIARELNPNGNKKGFIRAGAKLDKWVLISDELQHSNGPSQKTIEKEIAASRGKRLEKLKKEKIEQDRIQRLQDSSDQEYVDLKVRRLQVRWENAKKNLIKASIGLGADMIKIAGAVIGIASIALAATAFPPVLAALSLAGGVLAFISASIGFVRLYVENELLKVQSEPGVTPTT